MSKIKFASSLLFTDNGFYSGASLANPIPSLELTQSIDVSAEARDMRSNPDLSNVFQARQYDDWTSDIAEDLRNTTGLKGEFVGLINVRAIQLVIVKTAAEVSGSVAIVIPQFGIESGALNIGSMNAALAAIPVGGVIHVLSGYSAVGMPVGATNLTVDFTNPVGFAVKLIALGDFGD